MLGISDFEKAKDQTFSIAFEDGNKVDLTLTAVEINKTLTNDQQESFSVTFKGPADKGLVQANYPMKNETLGDQQIFIVPVSVKGDQVTYEAIYNRLKEK